GMISTMKVNTEVMSNAVKQDFSNATELADYLASKGLPFREAHEIVGKLVLTCIDRNIYLADLSLSEFQEASSLFEEDIYHVLLPETAVARRNSAGGTGFEEVKKVLERIKNREG